MTDEQLHEEIRDHLATFPERRQDVLEMKKEWNEWKSKSMWVLLGFSASLVGIGVWVGTIQTNIEAITGHEDEDKARFSQLEVRINSLEVTNGEIRARLSSIDATLQEIKIAIKAIR